MLSNYSDGLSPTSQRGDLISIPGPIRVRFVVEKVALWQVFLRFPLSVKFLQWFIFTFILIPLLPAAQVGTFE